MTDVANELTIGEMRQLAAVDALQFEEEEYYHLIRAKTASLMSGACASGALCGAAEFRAPLAEYGDQRFWAWRSKSPTTSSTTRRTNRVTGLSQAASTCARTQSHAPAHCRTAQRVVRLPRCVGST